MRFLVEAFFVQGFILLFSFFAIGFDDNDNEDDDHHYDDDLKGEGVELFYNCSNKAATKPVAAQKKVNLNFKKSGQSLYLNNL